MKIKSRTRSSKQPKRPKIDILTYTDRTQLTPRRLRWASGGAAHRSASPQAQPGSVLIPRSA
eukprot:5164979-Prymnesium_polylepis.2